MFCEFGRPQQLAVTGNFTLPVDYTIIPMEMPVVRQATAADELFWSVVLMLDVAIVSICCRL